MQREAIMPITNNAIVYSIQRFALANRLLHLPLVSSWQEVARGVIEITLIQTRVIYSYPSEAHVNPDLRFPVNKSISVMS